MSNQDRPAGKILRDVFFMLPGRPVSGNTPDLKGGRGKVIYPAFLSRRRGVGKRLPLKKRPHAPDRREYPLVTPLSSNKRQRPHPAGHASLPGRNGTSGTRAKIHAAPAGKRHASLPISGNREACPQPNEKTPLREITFWRLLPHQARGPYCPQGRPAHYPSYK